MNYDIKKVEVNLQSNFNCTIWLQQKKKKKKKY